MEEFAFHTKDSDDENPRLGQRKVNVELIQKHVWWVHVFLENWKLILISSWTMRGS